MISNDQELIQSDPTSCPQNQKGNNYDEAKMRTRQERVATDTRRSPGCREVVRSA